MTLRECYEALGGDYEEVLGRMHSERIVQKFVLKFLNDGSYSLLLESLETENYEEACRAAHSIKGVCQNMGFTRLFESAKKLNDVLRDGYNPEVPGLVEQVTKDYKQTVGAIRTFQEGTGA